MRFRHPDGSTVHLGYCSNVHPAEDVDGVIAQLARFAGPVRAALDASVLGVGLWLPAPAAATLATSPTEMKRLRDALAAHRLEVVTMNGFPYRGFHEPVVKGAVYHPDWTDPARAAYTLDLARILVELLPDDVADGSISTLPLAWRPPWVAGRGDWMPESDAACRTALGRVSERLAALEAETGRAVRLGLEPEPGCVLEETRRTCMWLNALADPNGAVLSGVAREAVAPEWVGVCLDACHLAVGFEDPYMALYRHLAAWRITVVKAQLSCALRSWDPARDRAELARHVEPRYLHQVRARRGADLSDFAPDLDLALAGALPASTEWRIHFHVPVHHPYGTTQPELVTFMGNLVGGPVPLTRHLEVETYTWSVLPDPPTDDAGLVAGLAAELDWTRRQLAALGLEEQS